MNEIVLPTEQELYDGRRGIASRFSAKKKRMFLEFFITTGSMAKACKEVEVPPSTISYHRVRDKAFGTAVEAILKEIRPTQIAIAEESLFERAVNGVKKGVYFRGEKVDEETVYSDSLLEFFLETNYPEKYGKKHSIDIKAEVTDSSTAKASMLDKLGITVEEIEEGVFRQVN